MYLAFQTTVIRKNYDGFSSSSSICQFHDLPWHWRAAQKLFSCHFACSFPILFKYIFLCLFLSLMSKRVALFCSRSHLLFLPFICNVLKNFLISHSEPEINDCVSNCRCFHFLFKIYNLYCTQNENCIWYVKSERASLICNSYRFSFT